MTRRKFQLTEEQIQELKNTYTSCKDGPTRTRYLAVRLYGTGYPTEEVLDITGCAWSTMMEWCRTYQREGIVGLIDKRRGGNRAKLTAAEQIDLEQRLHTYTPASLFGAEAASDDGQFWTIEDLQRAVQQWYDVQYQSRSSYHRLFDLCGFSYQRPAKVYKSRSEAKVVEFEAELEKELIDIVQESTKTVFLAEDEASLYLQASTMRVWAPRGQTPVVRVHPGREKVNLYGTLNLHTGQVIATRATKMNAEATALHLKQILEAIPDVPIVLLWDRAPWHSGQAIRDFLQANPRLRLIRFPVAAPDLNPQEHVWKATRQAVSHNHTVKRLPDLADRFEKHLAENTFESSFLDHYGVKTIYMVFN